MATIRISAPRSEFTVCNPPAHGGWKGEEGQMVSVMPVVSGDVVTWDIPDNSYNRSRFRSDFQPSGVYSAELVQVEDVVPFSVSATSDASTAAGADASIVEDAAAVTASKKK